MNVWDIVWIQLTCVVLCLFIPKVRSSGNTCTTFRFCISVYCSFSLLENWMVVFLSCFILMSFILTQTVYLLRNVTGSNRLHTNEMKTEYSCCNKDLHANEMNTFTFCNIDFSYVELSLQAACWTCSWNWCSRIF